MGTRRAAGSENTGVFARLTQTARLQGAGVIGLFNALLSVRPIKHRRLFSMVQAERKTAELLPLGNIENLAGRGLGGNQENIIS